MKSSIASFSILVATAALLLPFLAMTGCDHANAPAPTAAATQQLIPYTDALGDGGGSTSSMPQEESRATRVVRQRLEENIRDIAADRQPLEKVIGYLGENTNTNIFVNWTALQAAGVTRDAPVTIKFHATPYKTVLTAIIQQAAGDKHLLGYTIDEGVVTISTTEDLVSPKYQVVRVYDIRDLLPVAVAAYTQPSTPPTFGEFGTNPDNKHRSDISDATEHSANAKSAREIIENIKTHVAPASWRDNGGTIGSIRELNGELVINQTQVNQTAVYEILEGLRTSRHPKTTGQ